MNPTILHRGGRQVEWTLFMRSHSLENQLPSKHESLWKTWPVSTPWDSLCQSFSICLTGNHSGWNIPEIVLSGKTGLQFLTKPLFAEIFLMTSTSCSSRKDGETHQHGYLWKVLFIPEVFHEHGCGAPRPQSSPSTSSTLCARPFLKYHMQPHTSDTRAWQWMPPGKARFGANRGHSLTLGYILHVLHRAALHILTKPLQWLSTRTES